MESEHPSLTGLTKPIFLIRTFTFSTKFQNTKRFFALAGIYSYFDLVVAQSFGHRFLIPSFCKKNFPKMTDYSTFNDPLALILQQYLNADINPDNKDNKEQEINCNNSHLENSEISDDISASQQINDNSENVTNPKSCQICNNNDWKYKCPRCEFLTCSLTCSKSHKEKYNCNGIRSKTSFIPLNKYGYQELMNDYVLLEDLSRVIDATHRARIDQTYSQQKKFSKNLGKKKIYKTGQRGQKRYTRGSNIIK
ncbi:hypothetical protein Glove_136g142 [Diversispora epigaea]|uniref:Box C/D snoRNA protein 1 n=1 Tax=Diversispora epigaea TaxID=1348612 RepID=A0A397IWK8_9GLOM|nr:hypothetical protein Glove_136g142 [Diversispora epigaea]